MSTQDIERICQDAQDRVDLLADDCTKGLEDPADALEVVIAMRDAINIVIGGLEVDVNKRRDALRRVFFAQPGDPEWDEPDVNKRLRSLAPPNVFEHYYLDEQEYDEPDYDAINKGRREDEL